MGEYEALVYKMRRMSKRMRQDADNVGIENVVGITLKKAARWIDENLPEPTLEQLRPRERKSWVGKWARMTLGLSEAPSHVLIVAINEDTDTFINDNGTATVLHADGTTEAKFHEIILVSDRPGIFDNAESEGQS